MEKVTNLKEQLAAARGIKVMLDDENFIVVGSMQNFRYAAAREGVIVRWRVENNWPLDQPVPQAIELAAMIDALPDNVLRDWGGPLFDQPYSSEAARAALAGPFGSTVITAAMAASKKATEVHEAIAGNSSEPSAGA